MIGSKKAGSKASALGVLVDLTSSLTKTLALGAAASPKGQRNWSSLEAAKDFEAGRQRFEVEKYRVMLRRY